MRSAERLAILNGFGISLGDSIIGLQALRAGQIQGLLPRPVLFRRAGCGPMVEQIYEYAADFADVAGLDEFHAGEFGAVIDVRDFAFDPAFRGMAMIDYFLNRLGLDPLAVPSSLRRNIWLRGMRRFFSQPGLPERYVLVCPQSSMALRDMPSDIHARILEQLAGYPVVTQGPASHGAMQSERYRLFPELCGLVRGARCLVSTDTAMVHLADAFDVPCLAIFTTHRPEWRVRDYPLCKPLYLPVDELPEALEFSRGDDDLAAARANWSLRLPVILREVEAFVSAVQ